MTTPRVASLPLYVNTKGVSFYYVARVSEIPVSDIHGEGGHGKCIQCPEDGEAWFIFRDREQPFLLCDRCFGEGVHGKTGSPAGVYFLRAGEFVKIGRSSDIKKRIRELQTGCPYPIELWRHLSGGHQLETELHARFADERAEGEWFRISDRLRDYVERLPAMARSAQTERTA